MAKKQSKKNKEIKNNKNKNVLTEKDIENIKIETKNLIEKLETEKKHLFKSKQSKQLIDKQIQDLKKFLEEEQFYLLNDKLKNLKILELEEQEKIKKEKELNSKIKKENAFSFKKWINSIKEFDRWPIYSRIKKINDNYDGSEKWKRLSLVLLALFIVIIVMLIGILLIANVIPYGIEQDTGKIGPWVIFALPFAILFFI